MTRPTRRPNNQPVRTLLIIGAGHMGSAIARAATPAFRVVACDPDAGKLEALERFGVATAADAASALARAGPEATIVLAVKPQMLATAGRPLADAVGPAAPARGVLVISILAGASCGTVARTLGPWARVVRAMPNLPLAVGQGMTALCVGSGSATADGDLAAAGDIFCRAGRVVVIDEAQMDAFTAVAGSGPAYVARLAEWLADAAAAAGLGPEVIEQVVRQTVAGAGAWLGAESRGFGELRRAVTSKGGTTEAALGVLDESGVAETFRRAVIAGRDRGRMLNAPQAGGPGAG